MNNTRTYPDSSIGECQAAGFMTAETHRSVPDVNVPNLGEIYILPGKLIYVYITNMRAKPANEPKFMIVAYALSAPIFIIQVGNHEPHILEGSGWMSPQSGKCNSYPAVNVTRYKLSEYCHEQLYSYNTVKQSDKIWKLTCVGLLPSRKSHLHTATNLLAYFQSSKACGTDVSVKLKRYNTEPNWKRRKVYQLTLLYTAQGLRRENYKRRHRFECSPWTLSTAPRQSGLHLLSSYLRRMNSSFLPRILQVQRNADPERIPHTPHGRVNRFPEWSKDNFDICR